MAEVQRTKRENHCPAFDELKGCLVDHLDKLKVQDLKVIDLQGQRAFADGMIIGTSTSQRHMRGAAEKTRRFLEEKGATHVHIEGIPQCDWVLIEASGTVVHLFLPEIRSYYAIEKMWS